MHAPSQPTWIVRRSCRSSTTGPRATASIRSSFHRPTSTSCAPVQPGHDLHRAHRALGLDADSTAAGDRDGLRRPLTDAGDGCWVLGVEGPHNPSPWTEADLEGVTLEPGALSREANEGARQD